jgi:hypothetical protein
MTASGFWLEVFSDLFRLQAAKSNFSFGKSQS